MKQLAKAIVENDIPAARRLVKADARLALFLFPRATLYQKGIFHWIYAGDTALHLAAAGYRVEIARLLLRAGADVNAAGNHRRSTPLHYAADGCVGGPAWDAKLQVKTLQGLMENGADIHAQDANGATALHRAVRTRSAAAVRYLLEAGCDPETWNKPGSTAFHLAVQNTGRGGSGMDEAISAQREIIEAFLAAGASANWKDSREKTVRAWARSGWIREMLERFGS